MRRPWSMRVVANVESGRVSTVMFTALSRLRALSAGLASRSMTTVATPTSKPSLTLKKRHHTK